MCSAAEVISQWSAELADKPGEVQEKLKKDFEREYSTKYKEIPEDRLTLKVNVAISGSKSEFSKDGAEFTLLKIKSKWYILETDLRP